MMNIPIICVIGRKGSGKTRLIERLVKDLSSKGFKVSVFKHIHHSNFEVDVEGKDTWRFMQAGAANIVGVSRSKMFIMRKLSDYPDIKKLIHDFKSISNIIILEGFKYNLGRSKEVYKLIVAKDEDDAKEIMGELSEPILGVYIHDKNKRSELSLSYDELINNIIKLIMKS